MLSNNGLCLHTAAQYMLLLLILMVNSNQLQILRSYSSRPFLCTLGVYTLQVAVHVNYLSLLLSCRYPPLHARRTTPPLASPQHTHLPLWQSGWHVSTCNERIIKDICWGRAGGGVGAEQFSDEGAGLGTNVRGNTILVAFDTLVCILETLSLEWWLAYQ